MSRKPLVIELYAGLFGWGEGFVAEGFQTVGFDIVDQFAAFNKRRPPWANLALQDVLTLNGSQFQDAAVIVASPPCQAYSYRAMPWKQAKALTPEEIGKPKPTWWDLSEYRKNSKQPCMSLQDMAEWNIWRQKWPKPSPSNELFDACFRIQREASEAAGRYVPLVVENVCGAQKWVGRAAWHFGSFYLWGDVPALMPTRLNGHKVPGFRFDGSGGSFQTASVSATGQKVPVYSDPRRNGGLGVHLTNPHENVNGIKSPAKAAWFNDHKQNGTPISNDDRLSYTSSRSSARKQASAEIARIPWDLANWIARVYKP